VNRGLAIYEGKIFVPVIDGRLVALDAATGREIWSVQTTPVEEQYTMTMAPRIAKNKVIVGNAGAEKPVRGYFSAYNADTGKLEWRFYTVPGSFEGLREQSHGNGGQTRPASGGNWRRRNRLDTLPTIGYQPAPVRRATVDPRPKNCVSHGLDNLFIASVVAVMWIAANTSGTTSLSPAIRGLRQRAAVDLADLRIEADSQGPHAGEQDGSSTYSIAKES
jgi:hypothetical protein